MSVPPVIRIAPDGPAHVTLQPKSFLGGTLFQTFRRCIEGATFDGQRKVNRLTRDRLPRVVAALKAAGFQPVAPQELHEAVKRAVVQVHVDAQAAEGRSEALAAKLRAQGKDLYPFQRKGTVWLAPRHAALLADEQGCVDGFAIVRLNRAGKGFALPLWKLYRRFHDLDRTGNTRWDLTIPTFIRSLCNGELRLHRVRDVLDQGVRRVVCVTLRSGKSLCVTPDHELGTPDGFVRADTLAPGSVVLTNGRPKCKRCGSTDRVATYPYARFVGYCRACVYRYLHKNGIKSDNRWANLEVMTASEHMRRHGREGGYRRLNGSIGGKGGEVCFAPVQDRVVSVRDAGMMHVYDVVCEDPRRNFVANGIVVHNCGKTIEVLAALPSGDARRGVLVVGPKVAKGVWVRECRAWRPDLLPTSLQGRGSFRWPRPGELVVTNYEILPDALPPLEEPVVLVGDEVQALKNYEAGRTKKWRAVKDAVVARGGRVWGLTGTPLENTPPELWGVLQSLGLAQEAFGSYKQFAEIFHARKTRFGTEWGLPTSEAHDRLQRVMVRRTRAEVLPELPAKTYQVVECDLTKRESVAVDEAYEEAGSPPLVDDELPAFEKMSGTRAVLAASKIPTLLEVIEGYDTEATPIVVMSAHRAPVAAVMAKMQGKKGKPWAEITGDTPEDERTRIQDEFQAGRLAGVACTIRAAGVALTLTRAHVMIFVDREYNPAKNAQGEDRVCRIGQDRGVVIVLLVARHPLDEHIHVVLQRKQALINATLLKVGVDDEGPEPGESAGVPGTERVER